MANDYSTLVKSISAQPLFTKADIWKQSKLSIYWRFMLVVCFACAILIAREPHKITNAQFIAEDGTVFFAEAFNWGPWQTFFTRYAGYYHLIPRLLVAASMLLPYALIPLFYSLTTLLITALALTWFYLPQHRHLVQNDWVRLATVLLFLWSPNLAGLMQIAYLQWPLAVWALLVALTPLPTKQWQAWLVVLLYLLVIGTAPVVIVWLPVWLLRLYGSYAQNWGITSPPQPFSIKEGRHWLAGRSDLFWPFTVSSQGWGRVGWGGRSQLLCLILAHGLIVFTGLTAPRTLPAAPFNLWLYLLDFGRGLVYQVGVLNLLGRSASEWLWAHLGWWAFYGLGLALVVALLLALFGQKNPQKRFVSFLLLAILFTSSLLYLNRAELFGFIFANNLGNMHRGAARYFWIASVTFYLFWAIQVDSWIGTSISLRPYRSSTAGCLLLLSLYSFSFQIPSWGNVAWAPHARLLEHLRTKPSTESCQPPGFAGQLAPQTPPALAGSHALFLPLLLKPQFLPTAELLLILPIAPPGWVMQLSVTDVYVQRFAAPPTLVGAEEQLVDQALRVRLFWQADATAMIMPADDYGITAYLMNSQGRQVASDEAPLDQPGKAVTQAPTLFQSLHTLALPADHVTDDYHVAVSIARRHLSGLQKADLFLINQCIRL